MSLNIFKRKDANREKASAPPKRPVQALKTPPKAPKPPKAADGTLAEGVPLGRIIPRRFIEDPTLVVVHTPRTAVSERFRRLGSTLLRLATDEEDKKKAFLVTSAVPDEGKTTVAINLACAMAEDRDRSILLVDADLRRPSIGRRITPAPKMGLSEVLSGSVAVDHAIVQLKDHRLSVLPAGSVLANPLESLYSNYLAALFAEMRRRFDVVVMDTPPTLAFADASVIQDHCDGAVLVVRAGTTSRVLVEKASDSLISAPLVGAVLNGLRFTPVDRYYYGYNPYDPYESDSEGGGGDS